jgi:hypothetical protein
MMVSEDTNNFIIKKFFNCKIEEEEDHEESFFIHLVYFINYSAKKTWTTFVMGETSLI